jgi:hypothetical protein
MTSTATSSSPVVKLDDVDVANASLEAINVLAVTEPTPPSSSLTAEFSMLQALPVVQSTNLVPVVRHESLVQVVPLLPVPEPIYLDSTSNPVGSVPESSTNRRICCDMTHLTQTPTDTPNQTPTANRKQRKPRSKPLVVMSPLRLSPFTSYISKHIFIDNPTQTIPLLIHDSHLLLFKMVNFCVLVLLII